MSQRTPRAFARRKLVVLVAAALAGSAYAAPNLQSPPIVNATHFALPITFERNDGQFPASVMFVSHGARATLAVRPGEIALAPGRSGELALRFLDANRAPEIEPVDPLATRSHYYNGNDGVHDVLGVPHFGALRMKDVYPGIDVALHGRDGALEYDFVVAPGADPREIRIDLHGAQTARVDASGNLIVRVGDETLTQHAPVAWQGEGETRHAVNARFEIVPDAQGPEAHLALGAYDPHEELTIDPVLGYSSYVGASGSDGTPVVQTDTAGNIYYAMVDLNAVANPVVVTRLDPATNTIVYQTHFGGSSLTVASDLAVGGSASSNLYVAGYTFSTDFPVGRATTDADAFVAILSPGGTIVGARSIGGSASEFATSVALDALGDVYVGGYTNSLDFVHTTGEALNRIGASGNYDGFVEKLDVSLTPLWSRLIGSSGNDQVNAIAVDQANQVIAVGAAGAADFIQVNADTHSFPPSGGAPRAFAAKLTVDGTGLSYSEFIGGSADQAMAVAVGPLIGEAVVGGNTHSPAMYPAPARGYSGGSDAFVVRLGLSGTPTYATFLGGSGDDFLSDLVVNAAGDVVVTGKTRSGDFPVMRPLEPFSGGSDAFVTQLRHGRIHFSTYLGGSADDMGTSLALGSNGALFIAGNTSSNDFPVVNPYRATVSGSSDGFIARIDGLANRMHDFATDLNGDLDGDLMGRHTATGSQAVWLLNGLGASGSLVSAGAGYQIKFDGDFDGDGKSDLLFRGADGSYKVQLMDGARLVQESTILAGGTGWEVVGKGDFDGDGKTDLLWKAADGTYGLWLMNGGTYSAAGLFQAPGPGWDSVLVADFDGDGRSDILWQHTDGRVQMWLMNGFISTAQTTLVAMPNGWTPTHAADLDGDGKADIVWKHTNGSIGLWLVNGTNITSYSVPVGGGTGWSVKLVADLNGDGKDDVVLQNTDGRVGAWLMNGQQIANSAVILGAGTGWSLVTSGDFNGDGKGDLVWRYTDGSYGLWLMNGLSTTQYGVLFPAGTGWEIITP